jgi:hypothetical protein
MMINVPLNHMLEDKAFPLVCPFGLACHFIHQILSEHIIRINPGHIHIWGFDFMQIFSLAIVIDQMKPFMLGDVLVELLKASATEQEDLEVFKLLIQQAGQSEGIE